MITRDIRAFLARDWRAARDAKDRYWEERIDALGPAEALRIADELRRQVILQHPGWPSPDDRDDDLLSHARVAALLRRASPTSRH